MAEHRDRNEVVTQVIDLIVDSVNLQHLDKAGIGVDTALTQGGLGLDSVDILEVIVALEQRFGVKVRDAETGQKYFRTIGTVADFVVSEPAQV